MMNIAERLKELRKEKKISMRLLAEKSGVSKSTISEIEGGIVSNPTIETLSKLSMALGVDIRIFLEQIKKDLEIKKDKLLDLDEKYSSIKSQKEELIEHIQNIDDNLIKEYWELVNMLNLKDIAIIKDFKSRGLSLADAVKDLEKIVEKYK